MGAERKEDTKRGGNAPSSGLTNLDKVFPHKTITFEGQAITVTPLTAEDVLDTAEAFFKVKRLKDEGKGELDILIAAKDELKALIGKCAGVSVSDIPGPVFPLVARVILRQNFSADVLGNWAALLREGQEVFGGIL